MKSWHHGWRTDSRDLATPEYFTRRVTSGGRPVRKRRRSDVMLTWSKRVMDRQIAAKGCWECCGRQCRSHLRSPGREWRWKAVPSNWIFSWMESDAILVSSKASSSCPPSEVKHTSAIAARGTNDTTAPVSSSIGTFETVATFSAFRQAPLISAGGCVRPRSASPLWPVAR
jgi:hypothetical protein